MKSLLTTVLLLIATTHLGTAQADVPTLYQDPDLSDTSIVFSYAGDLWSVDRNGGVARPLTAGIGVERDARFSPDGSKIAFTGEYDGNTDVFVMPAEGGVPVRLSFHPGRDSVVDWTPDGRKILFRSSRASSASYARLFTVDLDGGLPEAVPLPHAFEGSFSLDGSHLAYQPITQWQPDWKRHKGGQTGRIWIARLADSVVETVPRDGSNDNQPAWMGDTVYFLSDRAGAVGIFAYDTGPKQVRQVLIPSGLDIKSLAAGPDALVYEHFGTIHILDPAAGTATEIAIEVEGDFLGVRPRHVKVGKKIANAAISPSGKRAVFEARGEILTVPAEKGDPRNLSRSPGVMDRDPAWSPDGKWIAYFSDESGEYGLHIADQKGHGEVRKIDLGTPPTFYTSLVWSPDSTKIAYSDRRLTLWVVDVDSGAPAKIDTNPIGFTDNVLEARWSPDSRWITYSRYLPNLMRAVFVHDFENHTSHQVTDGMSDAAFPCFDRNGKYLYFAASTDIGLGLSWADLSGIDHVSTRNVYAMVLSRDEPSPLAPKSDDEEPDGEGEDNGEAKDAEDEGEGEDESSERSEDEPDPTRIDLDAIGQRVIALPIPSGNIVALDAGKEGILFVAVSPPSHFGDRGNGVEVARFDLEEREVEDFLSGVRAFHVSADGEKVLYRKASSWAIAGTEGEPKAGDGVLAIDAMTVRVDPPAEWRQMFADAWRGERDHFYDPGHHGLDIEAAKTLYAPYLDAVKHREDLNYLFREMLNQLTIGHMFIGGGDKPAPESVPGGLLGCDFAIDNDRYRFAVVFDGENWNPDLRAPLTEPGVNVKAGEYLMAVNGRELRGDANVHQFFENTAGKQVLITVAGDAEGKDSREVTVVPVTSDYALRHRAWAEGNRRRVDELSDGRLAYVYMPNTAGSGFTNFNRYFFAQTDREGAVIDERYNGGGLLADYVTTLLARPQLSGISFRYAEQDLRVPGGAIYGPKAMLINGMAGSGGDAMPWYFQKMEIGPLVGTRTWGGLVASSPGPQLMDGGGYTAPDAAVYGLDGEWEVENAGVAPDIEVELDPAEWRKGNDPQLERAVQHLLAEIESNPRPSMVRPEYPRYERCCGLNGG